MCDNTIDPEILEYIRKYGIDITNNDPEDNPEDELLIPEWARKEPLN